MPLGCLESMVIDRLLPLSMVKYRLSALGTSRSWPRVASPCGFSNLITSAPIHASSCEQVGPACTWLMSRMRTPLSASMLDTPPVFVSACAGSPAAWARVMRESFLRRLVRTARRADIAVDRHVARAAPASTQLSAAYLLDFVACADLRFNGSHAVLPRLGAACVLRCCGTLFGACSCVQLRRFIAAAILRNLTACVP